MVLALSERLIDQVGSLGEKGSWEDIWLGDGVLQAGETIKGEDGKKHTVRQKDIRSYKNFEKFLESKVTSGDVKFITNKKNRLVYFLFSKEGELVITRAHGFSLADYKKFSYPLSPKVIDKRISQKQRECTKNNRPDFCKEELKALGDHLKKSAENYIMANHKLKVNDLSPKIDELTEKQVKDYLDAVIRFRKAQQQYSAALFAVMDYDSGKKGVRSQVD